MKKIALGFTGLAGIILSVSGAMAAGDTTVTSKSYVDAKLELREPAANKKNTLTDSSVDFPTTGAVKLAIQTAADDLRGEIDAIDLTPYEEKSNKQAEVTNGNRTSSVYYPSMGAIVDYVDSEIDNAMQDVEGDSDDRYQAKYGNTGPSVAISGAAWKKLMKGSYTTIDDSGANVVVDVDANKVASQPSDIISTSTSLTTAGAVYNYISNLPAAKVHDHVPTCDADHPCALVDNGAGQFVWVAIAQP